LYDNKRKPFQSKILWLLLSYRDLNNSCFIIIWNCCSEQKVCVLFEPT